jgi:hypothetical protein
MGRQIVPNDDDDECDKGHCSLILLELSLQKAAVHSIPRNNYV